MDFNFVYLNEVIEKEKVEIVNKKFGQNYVLMVLINGLSINRINFDLFEEDDVIDMYRTLEESITDEDQDGGVSIDPNHPYGRMIALSDKIYGLEQVEKIRPMSPFSFL